MNTWGSGIMDNDLAHDIEDEYDARKRKGQTVEEITVAMKSEYLDFLFERAEMLVFWTILAKSQWKAGEMLPEVQRMAIQLLDDALQNPSSLEKRFKKNDLVKLRDKLTSEMPEKKVPKPINLYKCKWKIGDVFAFHLESEKAKTAGIYGRNILIRKIDEGIWHPGHIIPIVHVKITRDDSLPRNLEQFDETEYIQTFYSRYEERFWPIDCKDPLKNMEEKAKIRYEVDEYGFLPQFRISLISASQRIIPKKLVYLGNYPSVLLPEKEFVPHIKTNIRCIRWGKNGTDFEENMIESYLLYNLRQCDAYSKIRKDTD